MVDDVVVVEGEGNGSLLPEVPTIKEDVRNVSSRKVTKVGSSSSVSSPTIKDEVVVVNG